MTDHVTQTSTGSRRTRTTELVDSEHLADGDRHELLASKRRRTTLDVLAGRSAPVDLAELARTVAARECDVDATDADAVERVAVSLHHNHLPKMDDWDVLDYDPVANRVV